MNFGVRVSFWGLCFNQALADQQSTIRERERENYAEKGGKCLLAYVQGVDNI